MIPPRPRPGGRSERVAQAAFAAALSLHRPGGRAPSIAEIAAKAGVQRTTLYRRWGGPEALLHEAMMHAPREAIPVPDTGSLRGDLQELARSGCGFVASAEGRATTRMVIAAEPASRQAYWERRYGELAPIFERAVARGELSADADWRLYLDVIIGAPIFAECVKGSPLPLDACLAIAGLLDPVSLDASCGGERSD